jgi:hypothetical protein
LQASEVQHEATTTTTSGIFRICDRRRIGITSVALEHTAVRSYYYYCSLLQSTEVPQLLESKWTRRSKVLRNYRDAVHTVILKFNVERDVEVQYYYYCISTTSKERVPKPTAIRVGKDHSRKQATSSATSFFISERRDVLNRIELQSIAINVLLQYSTSAVLQLR